MKIQGRRPQWPWQLGWFSDQCSPLIRWNQSRLVVKQVSNFVGAQAPWLATELVIGQPVVPKQI